MKVPKTFVPEKDLTERVNDYLNKKESLRKKKGLHRDPNLNLVISTLGVILRLEGENHRTIEQYLNKFLNESEEEGCLYVVDFLKKAEPDLPKIVNDAMRVHLEGEYNSKATVDIVESYLNKKLVISECVMDYVNMIIGVDSGKLGPNNTWRYRDPKTGIPKTITIDNNYMWKVENKLCLTNATYAESFRQSIRKVYAMKISTDPYYNFMDNTQLVNAITSIQLEAEINKIGSLVSALTKNSNEENKQIYERTVNNMINHHGYCEVCAKKTLEYFMSKKS